MINDTATKPTSVLLFPGREVVRSLVSTVWGRDWDIQKGSRQHTDEPDGRSLAHSDRRVDRMKVGGVGLFTVSGPTSLCDEGAQVWAISEEIAIVMMWKIQKFSGDAIRRRYRFCIVSF